MILILNIIIIIILVLTLTPRCCGYKILVYSPSLSKSHIISNGRIADVLTKAGHQVVMFIPEYISALRENGTEHAEVLRLGGIAGGRVDEMFDRFQQFMFDEDAGFGVGLNLLFYRVISDVCQNIVTNKAIMTKLRQYKFDIAITEQLDTCGIGVLELLKVPSKVWLSSCSIMEHMSFYAAIPAPPSYVPASMDTDLTDRMTYTERIQNLIGIALALAFHKYGSSRITKMFRNNFGSDFEDVDLLSAKFPLILVNSDEFVDFPRPILHKTVYIGGLGLRDAKSLTPNFDILMEKGELGVVFVSLGTIVKSTVMPLRLKQPLFEAFLSFPNHFFIFKCDQDDLDSHKLAEKVPNVHLVDWAPQVDLLGDRRLRAFLTHGGLNSVLEAAFAGVPIVTLAMFADQVRNGRAAERNQFGYVLSKTNLSRQSAVDALNAVLYNSSYKEHAMRISQMMRQKPYKAEQRLTDWIAFLGRFGTLPELQISATQLSFIQYSSLDILVPALFIFLLLLFLLFKIFLLSIFFCIRINSKSPVETKKRQ